METIKPLTHRIRLADVLFVVFELVLDWSVVLFVDFVVVLFVGFCASACFFTSRANRLRSASLLPEAIRPGFLAVAGFVFGTSEVTRLAVVSSGIVSSGRASIVYIYEFKKLLRFLSGFCQLPISFLPVHLVDNLRCLCLGVWEVREAFVVHRFQARFRSLCVL